MERDYNFLRRLLWRLRRLTTLRHDTDVSSTIDTISKSLEFKGENCWILACAIVVASVGLNVNSTAVIIGAMLISPLMGPINGIGLAIGINDSQLLRKSLQNLGVMVAISLCASTTYFFISPLSDARSELLARTTPTIFDVVIAFFGGMAGIIAVSRKQQSIAVISGVAIATALMPPLCTAGFFFTCGEFANVLGAFYLFFINSFFIALATLIAVTHVLHFPKKTYLNKKRATFVKRIITVFSVIVIVPSVFIAIGMVRELSFNAQASRYLEEMETLELFQKVHIIDAQKEYSRKSPVITLSVIGKPLTDEEIDMLKAQMKHYKLKNVRLCVKQLNEGDDIEGKDITWVKAVLEAKDRRISEQDSVIRSLRQERQASALPETFAAELQVQYPGLRSVSVADMKVVDVPAGECAVVPTVHIVWDAPVSADEQEKLLKWLKVRLRVKELRVQ